MVLESRKNEIKEMKKKKSGCFVGQPGFASGEDVCPLVSFLEKVQKSLSCTRRNVGAVLVKWEAQACLSEISYLGEGFYACPCL